MKVSIIIVNYNSEMLLHECLKSIYEQTKEVTFEVIVVDNASSDNSRSMVCAEFPDVRIIESLENTGFSRGNNLGVKAAKGSYLFFLNADAFLIENSIKLLANFLDEHPYVGAVGPKILYEDRCFQLSSGRLPNLFVELVDKTIYSLLHKWRKVFCPVIELWHRHTKTVGWLTGACMMVRKNAFSAIGGFDEKIFMYFEDKDLCKRLNYSGWKVVYYPQTSVIHLLAGSSRATDKKKVNRIYRTSQLYYYLKHLGKLQQGVMRFYLWATGKL
jgi:GT2 family glycosyltransferase